MSRLELFAVPAWQRDALCREYPDVAFFPSAGQEATEARAVCARCIVRVECLNFALTEDLVHGVFGGTTPAERRRIAATPLPPGSRSIDPGTRVGIQSSSEISPGQALFPGGDRP